MSYDRYVFFVLVDPAPQQININHTVFYLKINRYYNI